MYYSLFIFSFRVGIFISFLISMQHVITWPRFTFPSAILSLGHTEAELSTACRAAADALEILSNLRPGFTRNVMSLHVTERQNGGMESTSRSCDHVLQNSHLEPKNKIRTTYKKI